MEGPFCPWLDDQQKIESKDPDVIHPPAASRRLPQAPPSSPLSDRRRGPSLPLPAAILQRPKGYPPGTRVWAPSAGARPAPSATRAPACVNPKQAIVSPIAQEQERAKRGAMAAIGLPPGILFAPKDKVVYLLPCLLGWLLPADGLILDDDPLSASSQELLERNGHKKEAFFFVEGQSRCGKGTQQKGTCAGGGWWEGQKTCAKGDKLHVPDGSEAAWRKKALKFHCGSGSGKKESAGWVMYEYAVNPPPGDLARSPLRLCHIRLSSYGRKQSCGSLARRPFSCVHRFGGIFIQVNRADAEI
ncbi:LOW QUALITY PROTEIN: hypothetical protein SETIT_3G104500v2 [Setaria italica]|uniref:NAC domain-containing protein n=1 Tax=Setaria italica TaxID=4555 RepID=A0A368QDL4_SETIT|nr:LOW QUALITY PROTEIN: hypothetical protein SETIT_3G104500v2 [Setaria italica]